MPETRDYRSVRRRPAIRSHLTGSGGNQLVTNRQGSAVCILQWVLRRIRAFGSRRRAFRPPGRLPLGRLARRAEGIWTLRLPQPKSIQGFC